MTTGIIAVLLAVALVAATAIIEEEVAGWANALPRLVIRSAAKRLGASYCHRFEEEWLGELEHVPGGPLSKFAWASRIWFGRKRTAAELVAAERERRKFIAELQTMIAEAQAGLLSVTATVLADSAETEYTKEERELILGAMLVAGHHLGIGMDILQKEAES